MGIIETERLALSGAHIDLEPLDRVHMDGLAAASAVDPSLYQWSPVPQGRAEASAYIEAAIGWRAAGTAVPFAILRKADRTVIGSTRFWNLERWSWPRMHPSCGRDLPDACEIGYTWLTRSAVRSVANTEAKFLMLTHAFEKWKVLRVCFHTDVRNQRSRAALERLGAQFEGVLRSHRMAADFTPRNSYRYSILAAEWPAARQRLHEFLNR